GLGLRRRADGGNLSPHAMDLVRLDSKWIEQVSLPEQKIALRVRRRHAALVAPEEMNAIERERPRSRLFGHGSKKFLCNPPPRQRDAIGRVFEGGRCQFIQPAVSDGSGERVV